MSDKPPLTSSHTSEISERGKRLVWDCYICPNCQSETPMGLMSVIARCGCGWVYIQDGKQTGWYESVEAYDILRRSQWASTGATVEIERLRRDAAGYRAQLMESIKAIARDQPGADEDLRIFRMASELALYCTTRGIIHELTTSTRISHPDPQPASIQTKKEETHEPFDIGQEYG